MSDKVKERIEKEAHSLANDYTGDHTYNSGVFTGYVAGATSERPKAWNEAIDEAIKIVTCTDFNLISQQVKALEKLKHKQP